jgi:hypothetical protein
MPRRSGQLDVQRVSDACLRTGEFNAGDMLHARRRARHPPEGPGGLRGERRSAFRAIAEELYLSPHTVDAHLKHVYLELDIHSRVELTVLALRHQSPTA